MRMNNPAIIPLEAQYLYRRGMEMRDQHKENIALVYLRQAVFIAPEFSKAYLELGNCLTRLGRRDEASVYLGKVSRLNPTDGGDMIDDRKVKGRSGDTAVAGRSLTCPVT